MAARVREERDWDDEYAWSRRLTARTMVTLVVTVDFADVTRTMG